MLREQNEGYAKLLGVLNAGAPSAAALPALKKELQRLIGCGLRDPLETACFQGRVMPAKCRATVHPPRLHLPLAVLTVPK